MSPPAKWCWRLFAASPRRVYASLSSTVSHTPRCMKPKTAGRTRPSSRTSWPPGIPSGATDARAARIFLLIAGRRANDIPEFSGAPLSRSTIARRSPLPTTLQLADGLLLDPTGTAGTAPPGGRQPPAGAPAAHGYSLITGHIIHSQAPARRWLAVWHAATALLRWQCHQASPTLAGRAPSLHCSLSCALTALLP